MKLYFRFLNYYFSIDLGFSFTFNVNKCDLGK